MCEVCNTFEAENEKIKPIERIEKTTITIDGLETPLLSFDSGYQIGNKLNEVIGYINYMQGNNFAQKLLKSAATLQNETKGAAENKIKEIPKVKPKHKYSLKPCKVCGRKGIVYRIPPHKHLFVNMPDFEGRKYIECAECGLLISASTIKGAVFKWNRRGANNDD